MQPDFLPQFVQSHNTSIDIYRTAIVGWKRNVEGNNMEMCVYDVCGNINMIINKKPTQNILRRFISLFSMNAYLSASPITGSIEPIKTTVSAIMLPSKSFSNN